MINSYTLLQKVLFLLPPETAHDLTLKWAHQFAGSAALFAAGDRSKLAIKVGKTEWKTPIGLAAGLDKNALALPFFKQLGFGSMECGTVTVKPQAGNPKPRIFRYPAEASLRNAMGFPNDGMEAIADRLKQRPQDFPVAVNIGKSKMASPEEALQEYATLYQTLAPLSDWVVVNISSPNTPGLRDLQQEEWLKQLMNTLLPLKAKLGKDIFVKLAPDLDDEVLKTLTTTLADLGVDGLVATNTTHMPERGVGGVSGRLLRVKAHQKRKVILDVARDRHLPVVGVGGIESITDIMAWWAAGGEAVQVYTSFIYQGPEMLRNMESAMNDFLSRAKLARLAEFLSLSPNERRKLIAQFGPRF